MNCIPTLQFIQHSLKNVPIRLGPCHVAVATRNVGRESEWGGDQTVSSVLFSAWKTCRRERTGLHGGEERKLTTNCGIQYVGQV